MDSLFEQIEEWLCGLLITGIMNNMTGVYDLVNQRVGEITTWVGTTPENFAPEVFTLIKNLSENVIMPIAGIVLTFIACYELIQLVISHNNLANFETWIFFKWIFKTFLAVELISNTFNICMAVFDVAQYVVEQSGGIITQSTAIDASALATMQATLETYEFGILIDLFILTFLCKFLIEILATIIFVIVYARMIEIYMMVSLAPIPFATFGNKEQSMMGQNYVRSLIAIGLQGFLIMVCVGIYAVLIQNVAFSEDIEVSIFSAMGYTVLLAFSLFKSGTIAKSILHAH